MSILASFFRDFPIRQKQVSQIFMKPLLSMLIFQPGLEFSTPRAIREDRFWGFKNSPFWHFFGTNSTPEKSELLKPQNRSSGMALRVENSSPRWKISIANDVFMKIWLTWYLTHRDFSKKSGQNRHFNFLVFVCHFCFFVWGILFWSRGSLEQLSEIFSEKWPAREPGSQHRARQPAPT